MTITHIQNDHGDVEVTLTVHPSQRDEGALVVSVSSGGRRTLRIVCNEGDIGTLHTDGTFEAAQPDGSQYFIDTGMPLTGEAPALTF